MTDSPKVVTFRVDGPEGWDIVAQTLINKGIDAPLPESNSAHYSKDASEVYRRAKAIIDSGRISEALKYSALVVYKGTMTISLLLTIGAPGMHLSMTEVLISSGKLRRLADAVVHEAAAGILGSWQEGREGALPAVRHFYRR